MTPWPRERGNAEFPCCRDLGDVQQRKRDLFARVVDDEAMMGGALTAEDIRRLFA